MSEVQSYASSAGVARAAMTIQLSDPVVSDRRSETDNDEQRAWAGMPFPEGWYAGY